MILNFDSTFCIRWDASLKRMASIILMRSSVYYKYYKEMLGAMGTIAYEVQAAIWRCSGCEWKSKYSYISAAGKRKAVKWQMGRKFLQL